MGLLFDPLHKNRMNDASHTGLMVRLFKKYPKKSSIENPIALAGGSQRSQHLGIFAAAGALCSAVPSVKELLGAWQAKP